MQEDAPDVKEILLGGLLNENAIDLYRRYTDEDGEEAAEEIVPDYSSEPYYLYIKQGLYSRLWQAFDELDYEEQSMLAQRYGFCPECWGVFFMDYKNLDEYGEPKRKAIPQMMYTDIATDHEYSSANTAKGICDRALEKLRKAIIEWV